jgi:hypothetical protein
MSFLAYGVSVSVVPAIALADQAEPSGAFSNKNARWL